MIAADSRIPLLRGFHFEDYTPKVTLRKLHFKDFTPRIPLLRKFHTFENSAFSRIPLLRRRFHLFARDFILREFYIFAGGRRFCPLVADSNPSRIPPLRWGLHPFAEDFTPSSGTPSLRRRLHLFVENSIPWSRTLLEHNEVDTKNLYVILELD